MKVNALFSDDKRPNLIIEEVEPTLLKRGLASGKQIFSSFQNPQFRFYYVSFICQTAAMNMESITRSLLIYRITGSAAILGLMSLAFTLPVFILSYYGGFLADRYSKRKIMQVGALVSALLGIAIAITIRIGYLGTTHQDSWWILMVTSVIQGTWLALTVPSQQSILTELVQSKQVQNAVALNSMGINVMRMLGSAIAGFVIEYAGFDTAYFITGGLYLFGLAMLFFLPPLKRATGKMASTWRGLKEGISYLRHDVTIMLILGASLLVFTLGMPYFSMLPVFVDNILKVGASGMGILLTVNGAGAILSSLILAWRPPRNRGKVLLFSICFMSLAIIAFSFSNSWYLSLALMALIGIATPLFGTTTNSLLLNYTAKEYQGRIMSIFMMQNGLISVGSAIVGAIANSVGAIQWAVGGMAMILATVSIVALITVKRIRVLD
jgi:predicted MFS family arabinose efflux permease